MEGVHTAEAVIDNGPFGVHKIRFETGRLATQASGSAVVYLDAETMVLSATTISKPPRGKLDFFPLTVDVEERMYAVGRIPGSFFRREGRPSEDAILTCRLIDRPLRPSFVKGLRNEIQIVETIPALDPQHLSVYGLSVEPRTPLARWQARGAVAPTDEGRYAAEFLAAHEDLVAAGFEHYEVSNYARQGRRARHNSSYWGHVSYDGFGPSAHSFDERRRRWNVHEFADWMRRVGTGGDPAGGGGLGDAHRRADTSHCCTPPDGCGGPDRRPRQTYRG